MKVLMIRKGGVGDVMMLSAVAHAIKKAWDQPQITFYTDHPRLLENNPDIDRVNDLTDRGFDKVIDFSWAVESSSVSNEGRCSDHDYMNVPRLELFFRHAGLAVPAYPRLNYVMTEADKGYARSLVSKPFIVYCLHCTSPLRTYPIELSLEVLRLLSRNYKVIVLGEQKKIWGPGQMIDKPYGKFLGEANNNIIDMTDKTTIAQAAALVGLSDVVVTPDTGMMHLANALSIPCVALFGNIDPALRTSHYDNTISIFKKVACSLECGDRFTYLSRKCPSWKEIVGPQRKIGAACMWAITPHEVVEAVEEITGLRSPHEPGSETASIRPLVLRYCEGKGVDLGGVGSGGIKAIKEDAIVVDLARGRPPSVVADARNLHMFTDNRFDYVYSSHLLEDLESKDCVVALNEWFRILKTDGYLTIYCPVQRVYLRHCKNTGQSINLAHKEESFSLRFVKDRVKETKYKFEIVEEKKLINTYSFLLVLRKCGVN